MQLPGYGPTRQQSLQAPGLFSALTLCRARSSRGRCTSCTTAALLYSADRSSRGVQVGTVIPELPNEWWTPHRAFSRQEAQYGASCSTRARRFDACPHAMTTASRTRRPTPCASSASASPPLQEQWIQGIPREPYHLVQASVHCEETLNMLLESARVDCVVEVCNAVFNSGCTTGWN